MGNDTSRLMEPAYMGGGAFAAPPGRAAAAANAGLQGAKQSTPMVAKLRKKLVCAQQNFAAAASPWSCWSSCAACLSDQEGSEAAAADTPKGTVDYNWPWPDADKRRDKVALVIGNFNYQSSGLQLPATAKDAWSHWRSKLRGQGFDLVQCPADASREQVLSALAGLENSTTPKSQVIVVYVGRSVECHGQPYLMCSDWAGSTSEDSVAASGIGLATVVDTASFGKSSVILVEACQLQGVGSSTCASAEHYGISDVDVQKRAVLDLLRNRKYDVELGVVGWAYWPESGAANNNSVDKDIMAADSIGAYTTYVLQHLLMQGNLVLLALSAAACTLSKATEGRQRAAIAARWTLPLLKWALLPATEDKPAITCFSNSWPAIVHDLSSKAAADRLLAAEQVAAGAALLPKDVVTGAIPILVRLLTDSSQSVQAAAAIALSQLAAGDEDVLHELAATRSHLQALVQLLSSDSYEVQAAAASALLSLAAGGQRHIAALPGVISGLMRLTVSSDSIVHKTAMAAIESLVHCKKICVDDSAQALNDMDEKISRPVLDASFWILGLLGIIRSTKLPPAAAKALISMNVDDQILGTHVAAEPDWLSKLVKLLGCTDKSEQWASATSMWGLVAGKQDSKQRLQNTCQSSHAAVCDLVMLMMGHGRAGSSSSSSSSSNSSCSIIQVAAEALLLLAESNRESKQLSAASPAACVGFFLLLGSSCSNVQAAAAMALADAAADDTSRQQIAATDGVVHALVRLLNSSSPSVQEAAAAALCSLQQQVDLHNVCEPQLSNLRACSGLTLEGFRKWLAARTTGIVLLSGKWLLKQGPVAQPSYVNALAEQGYMQAAEGAEHMLLISPDGVQSLQQLLQEEELALQGNSRWVAPDDAEITSSPLCEGEKRDTHPTDQSQLFAAVRRNSIEASAGAGPSDSGRDQGASSTGLGAADTAMSAADGSALIPLRVGTCASLKLVTEPTRDWWDRGFSSSYISDVRVAAEDKGAKLTVTFKQQLSQQQLSQRQLVQQPECQLSVDVTMRACMQHEGTKTILGFKLQSILAKVEAWPPTDSASSSSGSHGGSSSGSKASKLIERAFMDRVCLSLQVQRQDGSESLDASNCNKPTQYDVEKQRTQKRCSYKYQDHVFKAGLELGLVPKGTLAVEAARKQAPEPIGVEVPLITVNTQAQGDVDAQFRAGSSPCTVEVWRQPLNTLLCNREKELGLVKSNPGTTRDYLMCYEVEVPRDCVCSSSGHLLADKLVVKMAISVVGGILTIYGTGKKDHDAQEVEVQGKFATSMVDGRVVRLGPLLPLQETPKPGCKVHSNAST